MKIAVIGGDGIGPEVLREAVKVLRVIAGRRDLPLDVQEYPYSADHYLETKTTIPDEVIHEFSHAYDAVLLGAVGDPRIPSNEHAKAIVLGMRSKLELFANIRPVRLLDARYCPLKGVREEALDFVVFRENTEDLYTGSGGILKQGTPDEIAIENSIHTRKGVERIIRRAFQYARARKWGEVVMSDKSNAMRFAGDLWQRTFREVGEEFPDISRRHLYVDALHMEVVRDPSQFKVIVTSNLFGDILTDLCAQLQGSIGLAYSANQNPGLPRLKGVYEPVHGSAPNIAGKGIANPMGAILTLRLLLADLGHEADAVLVEDAVRAALREGYVTPDLGGTHSTAAVGDWVCEHLAI